MLSPEYCKLSCHSLPTASRRPQQHIFIRMIESVEDLSLHGIEVGELVQLLVAGILEGGEGKRMKV